MLSPKPKTEWAAHTERPIRKVRSVGVPCRWGIPPTRPAWGRSCPKPRARLTGWHGRPSLATVLVIQVRTGGPRGGQVFRRAMLDENLFHAPPRLHCPLAVYAGCGASSRQDPNCAADARLTQPAALEKLNINLAAPELSLKVSWPWPSGSPSASSRKPLHPRPKVCPAAARPAPPRNGSCP